MSDRTTKARDIADEFAALQQRCHELEIENEGLSTRQRVLDDALAKYTNLFEFAPFAYLILDATGNIIQSNLTAPALMGTERKALVTRNLKEFLDPADHTTLQQHLASTLAHPSKQSCELPLTRADGHRIYIQLNSALIENSPPSIRSTMTDITVLHQTREELERVNDSLEDRIQLRTHQLQTANAKLYEEIQARRAIETSLRQEQRFNLAVIDTAQIIILVLDTKGRIVRFNKYMETLSGRTLAECRGQDWFTTFLPWREHRVTLGEFHRVISGTPVRGHRNPIVTRDGEEREIEWYSAALRDDHGVITGLLAAGMDVTDQVATEHSLKAREQQLSTLVSTAPDAIITHDAEGRITSFNPAAARLFGYEEAEAIGMSIGILMPTALRVELRELGNVREVLAQRKDGKTFPAELSASQSLELGLFTKFVRDVGERKELQRQLLTIADDQQRFIGQELHDDISQDLVSLVLRTENLNSQSLPTRTQDALERIGADLKTVLAKLRALSRGLIPMRVDPADLEDALLALTREVSELHSIHCEFSGSADTFGLDDTRATSLYHIAQEAISNAIKHANCSRIQVILSQEGSEFRLQVTDDGIGISAKDQKLKNLNGRGLLTMGHRASLLGGTLTVQRGWFKGTKVICRIPR